MLVLVAHPTVHHIQPLFCNSLFLPVVVPLMNVIFAQGQILLYSKQKSWLSIFLFLLLCLKMLAAYLSIIPSIIHNSNILTDMSILCSRLLYIHLLSTHKVQRNVFLDLKESQSIAVYVTGFLLPKFSIWLGLIITKNIWYYKYDDKMYVLSICK